VCSSDLLGEDGTLWGGEFLLADTASFTRKAHMRTFRLPGGDAAMREPRRAAVGLLHAVRGPRTFDDTRLPSVQAFTEAERRVVAVMLERGVNAPLTSSVGRLFDAVASLLGLTQISRHEGQAAMTLELALSGVETDAAYSFGLQADGTTDALIVDWGPTLEELLADVGAATALPFLSARFHNTLVEMIVAVAQRVGEEKIVLTGGCFQNRYLTQRASRRLRQEGFQPFRHHLVPPNDGGLALGQAVVAAARTARES
jgi:hydrogenase maturation protein HypF